MLGYAAHVACDGSYRSDPMQTTQPQQTFDWVDGYCKAHPLMGLEAAGVIMLNDFSMRAAEAH